MTIQDIFNSPAVKCVEIEILDMMTEDERSWRTPQDVLLGEDSRTQKIRMDLEMGIKYSYLDYIMQK